MIKTPAIVGGVVAVAMLAMGCVADYFISTHASADDIGIAVFFTSIVSIVGAIFSLKVGLVHSDDQ